MYRLEETHENVIVAVSKGEMLAATKVKMFGIEKKQKWTGTRAYNIPSIKRVTRKFLEVSRCSRAKQRQRNVQKSLLGTCKLAFLQIRPPVVVFLLFSLSSPFL